MSLVIHGCGGGGGAPAPAPQSAVIAPTAVTPAPTAAGLEERAVSVSWSDATATHGCFFFSGPPVPGVEIREVHGARATLRREQGTLSLDFGQGAIFRGPEETANLSREESYDYHGKWSITETIRFDVVGDGIWSGTYAYEECEIDSGRPCPGSCRLDAKIALE